jgi:hypothetical protein
MSDDLQGKYVPEPLTDEERRRDAELEALIRKITEEDPGYFDRLADRVLAEANAQKPDWKKIFATVIADHHEMFARLSKR